MGLSMKNGIARIGIAGVALAAVGAGAVTQVAAEPSQTASRTTTPAAAEDPFVPRGEDGPTVPLQEKDKAFFNKVIKAGSELEFHSKIVLHSKASPDDLKQKYGFTEAEVTRLHKEIFKYNDSHLQGPPQQVEPGQLVYSIGGGHWDADYNKPLPAAAKQGAAALAVVWTGYQGLEGTPQTLGLANLDEAFFTDLAKKIIVAEQQGKSLAIYATGQAQAPRAEIRLK